tara:strand:- start:64 stop:1035 length:972 start_codon:yes stop_codon:yes gene_type:complete
MSLDIKDFCPGQEVLAKWTESSNKFKPAVVLGIVNQSDNDNTNVKKKQELLEDQHQSGVEKGLKNSISMFPKLILRFSGFPDFKEIPLVSQRVQLPKKLPDAAIQKNINNLALMILNKISGTKTETFQKQLYNNLPKFRFLIILIQNDNPQICLKISQVILRKSQLEPGFNDLYTNLVVHLSNVNSGFLSVFRSFIQELLEKTEFQITSNDKLEYFSFLQFSGKLCIQGIVSEFSINQQLKILISKVSSDEIYIEAILKLMEVITSKLKTQQDKQLLSLVLKLIICSSKGVEYSISNRVRLLCVNYLEKNNINSKFIQIKKKH